MRPPAILHASASPSFACVFSMQFDAWPRVSFTTIGYGLIILIIAEVFRALCRALKCQPGELLEYVDKK